LSTVVEFSVQAILIQITQIYKLHFGLVGYPEYGNLVRTV